MGVLVLLAVLFGADGSFQAKATVMGPISNAVRAYCDMQASALHAQIDSLEPQDGGELQTFCVDVYPRTDPANFRKLEPK